MSALKVAVIVTDGFSPFHFSVPCIVFGSAMPEPDLFQLDICTEKPDSVSAHANGAGRSVDRHRSIRKGSPTPLKLITVGEFHYRLLCNRPQPPFHRRALFYGNRRFHQFR
ncbi:Uncharacterised protein [Serratia ficaria]|nr:Uncharacterised protein [Serratia ficaria]